MARIALSSAPLQMKSRYGLLAPAGVHMPPHGLGHIAAWLRKTGHEVMILDPEALHMDVRQTAQSLLSFNPDIIGISAVTMAVHAAADLAAELEIRNPALPVVLGGVHVSALPDETLTAFPHIRYAVCGEGEYSFSELIDCLNLNGNLNEVKGIAFRDAGGKIVKTPAREPIADLDALPFPAWDLYPDMKKYYKPAVFGFKKLPNISVVTSRGCPYRCSFCSRAVWGEAHYRTHSAAYIFEMFSELRKRYGIRDISVYDDTFGVSRHRMIDLCELILKNKLDVVWSCNLRANIADLEVMKLMKRAGCWMAAYGIESGSEANLHFLQKDAGREMIAKAFRLTKESGMLAKGYIMVGTLPDTHESLNATLRFILSTPIDILTVNAFTPMPGSLDYDRADQYGTFNRDWRLLNQHAHVFTPSGLKNEDIDYYIRLFTRKFYLRFRPSLLWKYIRLASHPARFILLVKGFITLLRFVLKRDKASGS